MNPTQSYDIVVFSIGPVQSFIATSRRTQDLASASRLLSLLSEAALQKTAEWPSARIIYPQKLGDSWPESLPNRLVICIPAGRGDALAEAMKTRVQNRWKEMAGKVKMLFNSLARPDGSAKAPPPWSDLGDAQINEWLEIYWACAPWDGEPSSYAAAFETASLGLEARKLLRHYPTTAQPGEKCTLCGTLSALGTEEAVWQHVRKRVRTAELRDSERLSAVSLLKRFAVRAGVNGISAERFPSTSSIASASFRATLLDHWGALEEKMLAFMAAVDELNLRLFTNPEPSPFLLQKAASDEHKLRFLRYDGDYFYPPFYTEEQVAASREEDTAPLTSVQLASLQKMPGKDGALGKLLRAARELSDLQSLQANRPSLYYAILAMDGDHIGRLLSQARGIDEHQAISQALARLALEMSQVVAEEFPGQVVYCGGDDLLALLPVECCLQAAGRLRGLYATRLAEAGFPDRTASSGLAIVHHLASLEAGVRAALAAERRAKDHYGRDALVVEVLKRSGTARQAGCRWPGLLAHNPIEQVRSLIASDQLSGKIAYDLDHEALGLAPLYDAHEKALLRLLKRHRGKGASFSAELLAAELVEMSNAIPEQPGQAVLRVLANWLMIARFLAQGEQE